MVTNSAGEKTGGQKATKKKRQRNMQKKLYILTSLQTIHERNNSIKKLMPQRFSVGDVGLNAAFSQVKLQFAKEKHQRRRRRKKRQKQVTENTKATK